MRAINATSQTFNTNIFCLLGFSPMQNQSSSHCESESNIQHVVQHLQTIPSGEVKK